MRFVDHGEIERRGGPERRCAALAACEFPADQIDAWRDEAGIVLTRLDAEQVQELALPLPDQRLRHDQQDALRPLRPALGNHQAGLNRLSQANFVGENAAAFAEASKGKDYCVNLVGVRINASLALCSRIAFPVIWTADPDEVLGKDALIEGVETHVLRDYTLAFASSKF